MTTDATTAPILSAADLSLAELLAIKTGTPKSFVRVQMTSILALITGAATGMLSYATIDDMEAATNPNGTLVKVYENNGDPADPLNGFYQADDSDPSGYVGAPWVANYFLSVMQPSIDLAQEWADGTEPGGPGTFSAREYAEAAEADKDTIVAAAATVRTPTYLDDISTGARSAVITITTDFTISAGTIGNLINGSGTNDDSNGVRFGTGQAVAGKSLAKMIFATVHASKLVGKVKFKQSGTQAYGTFQPKVRDMFGNWTNHGSTVSIGGSTEYEIDINALADTGVTGVDFVGVSGSTPANTNRLLEIEIQSVNGPRKDVIIAPAVNGLSGDTLVNAPGLLGTEARSKYSSPASQGGIACNYEYWFDDRDEVFRNRRSLTGLGNFDYSAGTYGKPTKTVKGALFKKKMISTTWTGVREIMIVKRCIPGTATTEREIATGTAGNPLYFTGSNYRDGMDVKVLTPFNTLMPLFTSLSSTQRQGATYLNRNGFVLIFATLAADFTGTVSLGGDIDEAANPANWATETEFALIKTWSAALPDDAARLAEADWVCRELAYERGIRLRGNECKWKRDIITLAGESQMAGQAIMSDRPKQIREMQSIPSVMIQTHERQEVPYMRRPAPFVAGVTSTTIENDSTPAAGLDGRMVGPEWKIAINHHFASRPVPLGILKGGARGATLGGGGTLSWLASVAANGSLLNFHLTRIYEMWRDCLERDEAPVMVSFAWSQGWNNSNLAAPSDFQTSYDTYYEAMIAKWLLHTGQTMIKQIIIQMPNLPAGNTTHDPTKHAAVQAKLQAIVDADPVNRVIVNPPTMGTNDEWGMAYGFNVDGVHYSSALLDYQGDGITAHTTFSTS